MLLLGGQFGGSSAVSLDCISPMCLVQPAFTGGHSLLLARFRLCIYLHPSLPYIFPLTNQCYRCLLPLARGLVAGRRGSTSHGCVILSRGWFCQKWKPLDIPGTHLHWATQLLTQGTVCYTNLVSRLPFFVRCGKKKDLAAENSVVHSSKAFLIS